MDHVTNRMDASAMNRSEYVMLGLSLVAIGSVLYLWVHYIFHENSA